VFQVTRYLGYPRPPLNLLSLAFFQSQSLLLNVKVMLLTKTHMVISFWIIIIHHSPIQLTSCMTALTKDPSTSRRGPNSRSTGFLLMLLCQLVLLHERIFLGSFGSCIEFDAARHRQVHLGFRCHQLSVCCCLTGLRCCTLGVRRQRTS